MKDDSIPAVLRGTVFDIEPHGGGFNIRLPKKKSEEVGPLVGWVSLIACIDRPDIVTEFMVKVYSKVYNRIVQREYEEMAEELTKKDEM